MKRIKGILLGLLSIGVFLGTTTISKAAGTMTEKEAVCEIKPPECGWPDINITAGLISVVADEQCYSYVKFYNAEQQLLGVGYLEKGEGSFNFPEGYNSITSWNVSLVDGLIKIYLE